jgi:hypothetical protein
MAATEEHAEQQAMELDALESILAEDLAEETDDVPPGWAPAGRVFRISLAPQLEEGVAEEAPLRAELVFAHTPRYPDEPPLARARGRRGLGPPDVAALQAAVDAAAAASAGTPMIYDLVVAVQEWLDARGAAAASAVVDPVAERKRREDEEEARRALARAHGVMCTPETYAEWRAKYDAELAAAAAAAVAAAEGAGGAGGADGAGRQAKLTGKQWFLQQEAVHGAVDEPDEDEVWSGEDEEEGGAAGSGSEVSEDESDGDDEVLDAFLSGAG